MNKKFSIPFIYPHTIYKLTALYRKEKKAQKVLEEFQTNVMNERRAVMKATNQKRNILIDHIILNEEMFTKEEIRDHILTFVSAYETWGNALAHTMLMLAIHPDVQDRLHEEINQIVSCDENLKNLEMINSINYLDLVLKEVFRMLPTVPTIQREVLEDFEIEPGLVIPKEVILTINIYGLHRRKEIWGENADDFIPERFLPENSANRHQFAYLPFSCGPRICIGYKYSIFSLKVAIIKLVKSFRFKTTMMMNDIRVRSYISLKLCTPHSVAVERRDNV
jgi:cytochrome P450 family 4